MGWLGYLRDALSTLLASITACIESMIDLGNGGCIITCLVEKALWLRARSGHSS